MTRLEQLGKLSELLQHINDKISEAEELCLSLGAVDPNEENEDPELDDEGVQQTYNLLREASVAIQDAEN